MMKVISEFKDKLCFLLSNLTIKKEKLVVSQ